MDGTRFQQIIFFNRSVFKTVLCQSLLVLVFIGCFVLSVQAANQKLSHDLFSASFPTEQEGWVCGRWGTIISTTDGGKTWVRQQSGTDYTLSSISFADPKNGWAVGNGGTILHTKDGGKIWVKQKSPAPYFLMDVQFVSPRKGWIVTERTTILYTEDGGQTWQKQFSDKDFILKRVSFFNERNGWAVGEYGYIYHTDNGGSTWKKQGGEFRYSEETGEMMGENFLFDVVAINPRTAWVVGIDGYVAKTLDGGATWQKVAVSIPKTPLFGVASDRKDTIIIGGNTFLLMSSDGGMTFKSAKVEPPITYGWIYKIVPKGSAGFVGVGKEGWIYLADKSGTSWHRVVY